MEIITILKKIAENIDMLAMKHKHKHLTATDTWMLVNIWENNIVIEYYNR